MDTLLRTQGVKSCELLGGNSLGSGHRREQTCPAQLRAGLGRGGHTAGGGRPGLGQKRRGPCEIEGWKSTARLWAATPPHPGGRERERTCVCDSTAGMKEKGECPAGQPAVRVHRQVEIGTFNSSCR